MRLDPQLPKVGFEATRRFQAPSAAGLIVADQCLSIRLTVVALDTGSVRPVCEVDQWPAEVRRLRRSEAMVEGS